MLPPPGVKPAAAIVTAVTLLGCVACWGSSSETPPPLEPDPERVRRHPIATDEPAPEPEPAAARPRGTGMESFEALDQPVEPAPRTWGTEPSERALPSGLKD